MARALSLDLRSRLVVAVENGLSRRAAAKRFAVSESCAIKLMRHWKRTGSVAPSKGAKKSFVLAPHRALVRRLVSNHSDHTLDELRDPLMVEGITVGRTSLHRYLGALDLTRKKRRSMLPSKSGPTLPPRARSGERPNRTSLRRALSSSTRPG
jgi:transposase